MRYINIIHKSLLAIVLTIIVSTQLFAQTVDYRMVKINQLPDEEIVQIFAKGEQSGLNDSQIYSSLKSQGMNDAQIEQLKVRISKLRNTNLKNQNLSILVDPQEQGREIAKVDNLIDVASVSMEDDSKPKVFGANLFRNSEWAFEPNLNMPTPKDYILGTGDLINLDITGDNEVSYQLPVRNDGTIKIQYVGIIPISGLTIDQAKSKITNQLRNTYPAINSGRTEVSLNLGNTRSIKVIISGYVNKPGTYTLPSTATVFNALYAASGPTTLGSFRNITVLRNNTVIGTLDTYDYLVKGMQTGNIKLQDQDVIHIPVNTSQVEFTGMVRRPGLFEFKENESILDLVQYAGGFATGAYLSKIKVIQKTDREKKIKDIYFSELGSTRPTNGDQYFVEEILDRFENRVQIEGAVFRPGYYELNENLTVKELIALADGIKDDAFLERAYINRLNENNTQKLLSFDLKKLLDGSIDDIKLRREDRVIISSIFDLREEFSVSINGEVRNAGKFKFAENMTLGNLIHMAGGLTDAANIERIEVARRIRLNLNQRDSVLSDLKIVSFNSKEEALMSDFILEPFDIVSIRSSTGYLYQRQVKILGEVKYPGSYTLVSKDERISDLIARAGGFTEFAYLDGASLRREVTNSEIALQNSISGKKRAQIDIDNIELEDEEMKQSSLEKLSVSNDSELYFNKNIGINLPKIVANPESKYDVFLEEGDILSIPRKLQTVKIVGEVLSPIAVVYAKGKNLKYYIHQAGGFSSKAHKSKTFVQYANGSVKGTRKFIGKIYPDVKPGTEIIVPAKPEKKPLSAQAIVGLSSGVVSMLAIIVSLLK